MKYRVETIVEVDGIRNGYTDWCADFGEAFMLFTMYVKMHCLECIVYSVDKGQDILMYLP